MSEIEPGDGWGLIGRIEYVRIPAKPEALEIDHQTIKCNSFNEVMASDEVEVWRLVSNPAEARTLADWLNRYADWREAQDAAK